MKLLLLVLATDRTRTVHQPISGLHSRQFLLQRLTISFLIGSLSKMAETRTPNKLYATHPKGYGKGSRACRVTGRLGGMGLIRKYGINMKRQVFRERAIEMGWEKHN